MKDYPIEKYKFYQFTDKNGSENVVAVSTYAGKVLRGVAKCHPSDKFDLEAGKELAAERCAAKVAKKRYARAQKCYAEAAKTAREAICYLDKMGKYLKDARAEFNRYQ